MNKSRSGSLLSAENMSDNKCDMSNDPHAAAYADGYEDEAMLDIDLNIKKEIKLHKSSASCFLS